MNGSQEHRERLAREAKHWGDRLAVEGTEQHAWLDHPVVRARYRERALLDGLEWEQWVTTHLGAPAERSMELGCGSASRSIRLFERGWSRSIAGIDVSKDRVEVAEQSRRAHQAPGGFRVGDANALTLEPGSYDLIFSCHSFHHFAALEHVMAQVATALTPRGLFVLEEFVGPTQFQWTDRQIALVRALLALLPERLRHFRWGAVKAFEGRPTPAQVVAVSPFESIRSADIAPLFERQFQTVAIRRLGGTLQHLLYNGIIHNFGVDDPEARGHLRTIYEVEDALVDGGLLPSDFMLLVGQRRA